MTSAKDFKVLIVDDQASDIANLNFLARSLGIEVSLAFDGKDAWRLVGQKSFDLIILDWHMPVMPGWTFLKKLELSLSLKRFQKSVAGNIVIHTAEPMMLEDFSSNAPFRILDVWQKPLHPLELIKKMNRVREQIGGL